MNCIMVTPMQRGPPVPLSQYTSRGPTNRSRDQVHARNSISHPKNRQIPAAILAFRNLLCRYAHHFNSLVRNKEATEY